MNVSARFAAFLSFASIVLAAATPAAGRPNIIVILTDDLGYADLGAQGHERDVRTPNLDHLPPRACASPPDTSPRPNAHPHASA